MTWPIRGKSAVLYGGTAVFTAIVLYAVLDAGAAVAILAALSVGLAGALAQEVVLRHRTLASLADTVDALDRRQTHTEQDLERLRAEMADLSGAAERSRETTDTRTADLHTLKTLVEQLASKLETEPRGRQAAASAGKAGANPGPTPAEAAPPPPLRMGPARLPPVPLPPPPPEPVLELPDAALFTEALPDEDLQLFMRIREALQGRSIDVLVQPIVRLPQRRVEYFAAFPRLRAADGSPILPEAYHALADRAGFIPSIDELVLPRTVDLVRRDIERRSGLPYFCRVTTPDTGHGGYFRRFVDYLRSHTQLAHGLVPTFAQADFRLDDHDFMSLVAGLGRDGYRLAIDRIESLDLDLYELANRNVKFLKVTPAILLDAGEGEAAQDGERFKSMLERLEIALVAEHVDSESLLLELLDYEIDFGQGYLFGGLRKSF